MVVQRATAPNQITLARSPILTVALLPCLHGVPHGILSLPCSCPVPTFVTPQPAQGYLGLLRLKASLILFLLAEVPEDFCLDLWVPLSPLLTIWFSMYCWATHICQLCYWEDLWQGLLNTFLYLPQSGHSPGDFPILVSISHLHARWMLAWMIPECLANQTLSDAHDDWW